MRSVTWELCVLRPHTKLLVIYCNWGLCAVCRNNILVMCLQLRCGWLMTNPMKLMMNLMKSVRTAVVDRSTAWIIGQGAGNRPMIRYGSR